MDVSNIKQVRIWFNDRVKNADVLDLQDGHIHARAEFDCGALGTIDIDVRVDLHDAMSAEAWGKLQAQKRMRLIDDCYF